MTGHMRGDARKRQSESTPTTETRDALAEVLHEFHLGYKAQRVCESCRIQARNVLVSGWFATRVHEAEQRGAVKALREAVAAIRASRGPTCRGRCHDADEDLLLSRAERIASTSRDTESEPDDPPATRDMDPMWGRDTEQENEHG